MGPTRQQLARGIGLGGAAVALGAAILPLSQLFSPAYAQSGDAGLAAFARVRRAGRRRGVQGRRGERQGHHAGRARGGDHLRRPPHRARCRLRRRGRVVGLERSPTPSCSTRRRPQLAAAADENGRRSTSPTTLENAAAVDLPLRARRPHLHRRRCSSRRRSSPSSRSTPSSSAPSSASRRTDYIPRLRDRRPRRRPDQVPDQLNPPTALRRARRTRRKADHGLLPRPAPPRGARLPARARGGAAPAAAARSPGSSSARTTLTAEQQQHARARDEPPQRSPASAASPSSAAHLLAACGSDKQRRRDHDRGRRRDDRRRPTTAAASDHRPAPRRRAARPPPATSPSSARPPRSRSWPWPPTRPPSTPAS